MKHKKQESLFSIESHKRKFYSIKKNKLSEKENSKKLKYDLKNENIYHEDGSLQEPAKQLNYEIAFRAFFNSTNLLDIELFLNWHYQKSNSPKAYLTYVKSKIFHNSTIDEGIKCIVGDWVLNYEKKTTNKKSIEEIPIKSFEDIFTEQNWKQYIDALKNTNPPLLDNNNEFIGNPYGHKGVICSWFKELQNKQIIKITLNRNQLALIVNQEIKNFILDKHGKTFDNYSKRYVKEFKNQLFALSGLK